MIKITKISPLDNHCILLVFSDGVKKIVDLSNIIQDDELTKPLANESYFKRVKIYSDGRGIYWDNSFDLCPDYLRYYAPQGKESNIISI